ncbi:RHS repeat-associated core domain-containing protein, partial [Enterobacter intestinihominis]
LLKHYEARQGHSRAQISYDAADNLAASDDAVPVTDNRLQHSQALFMKYDHWGNLVSRRIGLYEQHYAYDAENRLVSAGGTGPEGGFEARYHYDALGRRTR